MEVSCLSFFGEEWGGARSGVLSGWVGGGERRGRVCVRDAGRTHAHPAFHTPTPGSRLQAPGRREREREPLPARPRPPSILTL